MKRYNTIQSKKKQKWERETQQQKNMRSQRNKEDVHPYYYYEGSSHQFTLYYYLWLPICPTFPLKAYFIIAVKSVHKNRTSANCTYNTRA